MKTNKKNELLVNDEINYSERRSRIKQYFIFIDDLKINPSFFEDAVLGKCYKLEDESIYEVCKIQKNEYANIEFVFLTKNYPFL
jgi:hypothetical protein